MNVISKAVLIGNNIDISMLWYMCNLYLT